jgi:predicted negative regulator of RcsB-dependent stress response
MIHTQKTHTKKLVGLALLIAGGLAGYQLFASHPVAAESSLTAVNASDDIESSALISMIDKIESIQLDNSIFANSVFLSLEDNTVTLPTPVVGRPNPFAPVGGTVVAAPKKTTTTKR